MWRDCGSYLATGELPHLTDQLHAERSGNGSSFRGLPQRSTGPSDRKDPKRQADLGAVHIPSQHNLLG